MKSQKLMKVVSKPVEEVTMSMDELQHLVDIYFDVIMASITNVIEFGITKEEFYKDSGMLENGLRNRYMKNAANHLETCCGIKTSPQGLSWGVIREIKQDV